MINLRTLLTVLLLPMLVWFNGGSELARAADGDSPVAAMVGETPVRVADVEQALAKLLHGQQPNPGALMILQAKALDQLVNQKLVQQYLERNKQAAADYEIDQAVEAMQAKLKEQNVSWEALLKQRNLSEEDVRKDLAWELSWKKYLQQEVSDDALKAYFEAHRREYDGSQLGVSHILLRPVNSSNQAKQEAIEQIKQIHAALTEKKMTFEEAAKTYSVGPSADQGGDLGFIPRRGVMDEIFSRAAFALEIGEISPPIQTRFGYHILRATKLKPGEKTWQEAREEMLPTLAQERFQSLANAEREKTEVKFTGALPYIRPGTEQVVPASR